MIKALARFSIACGIAITMAGCAVSSETDEEIAQNASELKITYQVFGRATYDAQLNEVMVDLATTEIPPIDIEPSHDPHISTDQFFNVRVRRIGTDGTARIISVVGGTSIGPGGGCIHFSVPAAIGDTLAIDGVVRIGGLSPRAAQTGLITVVSGDWVNDQTVALHPHDH